MTKPCPHCTKPISSRRITCGSRSCLGAESVAWLEARMAVHRERVARRARTATRRRITPKAERAEIFKRDNWTCHLCRLPIDAEREWPDPLSPVIDHVFPLIKGGSNEPDNLAAAHAYCNNVKADRLMSQMV